MKIAVEGFMHGDLDKVYKTIKYIENTRNIEIDLLLCCGDFEAVRNERDMDSLNAPPKYREMKSFWKYYSAHLHCKFTALVEHEEGGQVTKFLALDKCLPGLKFLQIVDIESDPGPYEVQYDEEWLAIT
ncbi:hypothetical protein ES332_A04G000300v1 [Gossypium tomentosum]|uniref:Lariat debranching enzyme C-terminal domain-containing protein n=1 Tax=Gossypium tomentosum TaxID=34277 RepID=A0A5D2QU46_GOSTO|nr:hypothetical protein ES332_A04G000300v1 [Gossypium tomentosum]